MKWQAVHIIFDNLNYVSKHFITLVSRSIDLNFVLGRKHFFLTEKSFLITSILQGSFYI